MMRDPLLAMLGGHDEGRWSAGRRRPTITPRSSPRRRAPRPSTFDRSDGARADLRSRATVGRRGRADQTTRAREVCHPRHWDRRCKPIVGNRIPRGPSSSRCSCNRWTARHHVGADSRPGLAALASMRSSETSSAIVTCGTNGQANSRWSGASNTASRSRLQRHHIRVVPPDRELERRAVGSERRDRAERELERLGARRRPPQQRQGLRDSGAR